MHVTIKIHSGVIIYLRTVKIKRENGRFDSKRWHARDVSISLAGKLRRNCGEVAGKTSLLLMLISLSGWLLLALCTVLV